MVPDPRSRRSRKSAFIVPIALTLTAVVAGAAFYYFNDRNGGHGAAMTDSENSTTAESTDTEREPEKKPRKSRTPTIIPSGTISPKTTYEKPEDDGWEKLDRDDGGRTSGVGMGNRIRMGSGSRRSTRGPLGMEPDRITEEDTDDLEEPLDVGAIAGRKSSVEDGKNLGDTATQQVGQELNNGITRSQYIPIVKKKSVAVVVAERKSSTERSVEDFEHVGLPECLLTHLPQPLDLSHTNLNIFVYTPLGFQDPFRAGSPSSDAPMRSVSPDPIESTPSSPSTQSSPITRKPPSSKSSTYTIANSLLPEKDQKECVHRYESSSDLFLLLRQCDPEILYIDEVLAGPSGEEIEKWLESGWLGVVVVVVGVEGILAGSDDETDTEHKELKKRERAKKWWQVQDGESGGLKKRYGSRLQIVEGFYLGDDWKRRVEERGD